MIPSIQNRFNIYLFSIFCVLLYPFLVGAETENESITYDNFALAAIPKCGTHLLVKCISNLTGLNGYTKHNPNILAAIEQGKIEHKFVKRHDYYLHHKQALINLDYKWILIVRDPRDALISLVFYMNASKFRGRSVRDFYTVPDNWDSMSFDEQLYAAITAKGIRNYLHRWYKKNLGWIHEPNSLVVKYEDLIGSRGNGDDLVQKATMQQIVGHLNISIGDSEISRACDTLFSQRAPLTNDEGIVFERGQIGNWKKFFKRRHIRAFKKTFNDVLVNLNYEPHHKW